MGTLTAALVAVLLGTGAATAAAEKVNLVYVENAPAPIGNVTTADIQTLADSKFTHIVFAFANFYCHGDDSPPGQDGTCKAGRTPTLQWNVNDVYDSNGAPYDQIVSAVSTLTGAGKTVLMSLGGWNQPTWDNIQPEIGEAASALNGFIEAYGMNGVDLDYEGGSQQGFTGMAKALAPKLKDADRLLTIVPYTVGGTQDQYAMLVSNGVTPDLVSSQFYAGGITGDVPGAVSRSLESFDYQGTNYQIPAEDFVVGLAPSTAVPAGQNNCGGAPYSGCADIVSEVVQQHADIGGVFVWDWHGVDPKVWAAAMAKAMGE